MSLENQQVHIARLTPFSASGSMSLAENNIPTLSVPRFELLFTPASLLKKQISALVLDNTTLHLIKQDGKIHLRTVTPSTGSAKISGSQSVFLLPFMVDKLILKQCSAVLHETGRPDIRLSISAAIAPVFSSSAPSGYTLSSLTGNFMLSELLTAQGTISSSQQEDEQVVSLVINSGFFMLPEHILQPTIRLAESGPLSARVSFGLDKKSLSLNRLDVQGNIAHLNLKNEFIELTGAGHGRGFTFSLNGTPQQFDYRLSPFTLRLPAAAQPLTLEASITGRGSLAETGAVTTGKIQALVKPPGLDGERQIPAAISYSGNYQSKGSWDVDLTGQSQPDEAPLLHYGGLALSVPPVSLSATLEGDKSGFKTDLELDLAPFEVHFNQTPITLSGLDLHLITSSSRDKSLARITAEIVRISLPKSGFFADNLHLDLPLSRPFAAAPAKSSGSLSISSFGLEKEDLASFQGSLSQRDNNTLGLTGTVQAAFEPDLKLALQGSWIPLNKQFDLAWDLPPLQLGSYNLPPLLSPPDGVEFTAEFATSGNLRGRDQQLDGSMLTSLRHGNIEVPEKNISIENITCALENPRLPDMSSAPSQRCTIGAIDAGTLSFSDGALTFRLEDARTLFVEGSTVKWSQGTLESGSMRLTPDDMDVETIIYCNRVNFADLLNQFGFDQTEGQGALNGKLPVKINKSGITFNDGFLFSTPGTGGIVRFNNTDLLRQGMGGMTQAGYLSYSLMALEDFAYNWTRLSFNSSGSELLMTMELDGKPSSPLPFTFKNGTIVETEKGTGLQYPLRLDVNFRLPLNELLQMGRSINSIMGNK